MNKYQNFLVQAGRQCWPGDHGNMVAKVARRPYDVKADEWIYNLIKGGSTAGTSADTESFKDNDFSTVDTTGSTSTGFYIREALAQYNMLIKSQLTTVTVLYSLHGVTNVATLVLIVTSPGNQRPSGTG